MLLFNEELEVRVRSCINVFDPVCVLINKSQSTHFSIADASEEWLQLVVPKEHEEFEDFFNYTLRKIDTKNEILECWILPYII